MLVSSDHTLCQISALVNQTVSQLKFGNESGGERARKRILSGSCPYLASVLDQKWRIFLRESQKIELRHSLNLGSGKDESEGIPILVSDSAHQENVG